MIYLSVLFGLYVLATGVLIIYLLKSARQEREQLEDRVMALSKPEALITHKALTESEPAVVSYMDERAEYEVAERNGQPTLLGEED
jgi:hypothetical protein